ncbi:hypothetical protein [Shivajiella indica]|uniref:Lipocalin-like domain-containing protein n=1 Tax=Shivajiella indica TaxID=872115 RepID=A0ABW5B5P5_9BACT
MKIFLYAILFLLVLTSCDKQEDKGPEIVVNGTWEIIEIVSPLEGTRLFKDEIDYTETYIFLNGGTFLKFNSKTDATLWGTYKIIEPSEIQVKEIHAIISLNFDLSELRSAASQFEDVTDEFCWTCPSLGSFVYGWGPTERLFLYIDNRLSNPGPCCFKDLPTYNYSKIN